MVRDGQFCGFFEAYALGKNILPCIWLKGFYNLPPHVGIWFFDYAAAFGFWHIGDEKVMLR